MFLNVKLLTVQKYCPVYLSVYLFVCSLLSHIFDRAFLFLGSGDSSKNVEGQPLSDEVSQLLKDIEEFRAFMTDEYAEEIANNLQGDCITH